MAVSYRDRLQKFPLHLVFAIFKSPISNSLPEKHLPQQSSLQFRGQYGEVNSKKAPDSCAYLLRLKKR